MNGIDDAKKYNTRQVRDVARWKMEAAYLFPLAPLRPRRPRLAVCGLSNRPFFPAGLGGRTEGPASSAVAADSVRAAGSVGARARLEERVTGPRFLDLH